MENVRFCLGAQQLRVPPPRLPPPSLPGADAVQGPGGPLPTRRQGSFMGPGGSRRNQIQVVSKVTDCEGPGGPPLTAGLRWEAPGGQNRWGEAERDPLAGRLETVSVVALSWVSLHFFSLIFCSLEAV